MLSLQAAFSLFNTLQLFPQFLACMVAVDGDGVHDDTCQTPVDAVSFGLGAPERNAAPVLVQNIS